MEITSLVSQYDALTETKARPTGVDAYAFALRQNIRAFWAGRRDFDQFLETLNDTIRFHLELAWREGAMECGVRPDERTPEEDTRLRGFILNQMSFTFNLAEFAEANTQAEGGLLRTSLNRLPPWINRYNEVKAIASTMACADQKFIWLLGQAEHCFPKGTKVKCLGGEKNIEDIQIGEYVWTTDGLKPVTNLFRKIYLGDMIEVISGDNKVVATPNHPFLTKRGWVRADALTLEDTVFIQDAPYNIHAKAMFPDTFNSVLARLKVSILGIISFLLGFLSIGKWFKSRVPVPIFAVCLYNKIADLAVNDKARFNQKEGHVFNIETIKYSEKFNFKFGRITFLKSRLTFGHFFKYPLLLFGMIFPILPKFFFGAIEKHRVIFGHILPSLRVYNFVSRFFAKGETKFISLIAHLGKGKPQSFGNNGGSLGRIVPFEIFDFILIPYFYTVKVFITIGLFPSSLMTTSGTGLQIKPLPFGNSFSSVAYVSTSDRTIFKSSLRRWIDQTFKSRLADFANKVNQSGHKLSPCSVQSLDTLYHNRLPVYNLEVDEVHNYIANGFVVHNCKTCLKLAGRVMRGSQWDKLDVHPQDTRPGKLACRGFECKCRRPPTNKRATPGRLPKLP